MVQRDLDHLIQDVLDGVASADQTAELEARLRTDPAARARKEELEQVFGALQRATRFAAPPELRAQVLRSLPPGAPGIRSVASAESARRLRFAYGLAAVLLALGLGAGAMTGLWKAPSGPVNGAIMPSSPAPPASQVSPLPPSVSTPYPRPRFVMNGTEPSRAGLWQVGSRIVEARTWRVGGSRVAVLRATGGDTDIELGFDSGALTPVITPGLVRDGNRVRFVGTQHEIEVEFLDPRFSTLPLQVTLRAANQTATGELPAPPAPNAAK